MRPEAQELTVTLNLQPVAYKDLDPMQRAAWDSFWGELIRSVSTRLCRPQVETEGDTRNQRCVNNAVVIAERTNDNPSD
jgi:hypothetical protein